MDTNWRRQELTKPLFEDLLWSRPEQRSLAGKLLIVGGNSHAIASPSEAYQIAQNQGAGEVRVALPDKTRKLLGPKVPVDIELVQSTLSGSFSAKAEHELQSFISWADATLFAGDIGRNSETAVMLESIAQKMPGLQIYTRDAIDYFYSHPATLLDRENTLLVVSIAQLQKLCTTAKFETPITFSMGLVALCEALTRLTSHYKAYICVLDGSTIVTAVAGHCISTKLPSEPTEWRLKTASAASVWWLQNPSRPLESIATAITQLNW